MAHPINHSTERRRRCPAGAALALTLAVLLVASACDRNVGSEALFRKARQLWQERHHLDAARSYVTLTEVYPTDRRVEAALYWAASLNQFYLGNSAEAARNYTQLLTDFPRGSFALEAQENLALLYEQEPANHTRAVQAYRKLLAAEALRSRHHRIRLKLARLYLKMGRLDRSRFELRELIRQGSKGKVLSEAYYLVGYSFFLEGRFDLAVVAFTQLVKEFPGTPVAAHARFFMADTLEEQGKLRQALKIFSSLQSTYHNPKIIRKRIASLKTRMRSTVR